MFRCLSGWLLDSVAGSAVFVPPDPPAVFAGGAWVQMWSSYHFLTPFLARQCAKFPSQKLTRRVTSGAPHGQKLPPRVGMCRTFAYHSGCGHEKSPNKTRTRAAGTRVVHVIPDPPPTHLSYMDNRNALITLAFYNSYT